MTGVQSCLVAVAITASVVVAVRGSETHSAAWHPPTFLTSDETRFGGGPWVFARGRAGTEPIPWARYEGRLIGDVEIRLDDGRRGALRVEQKGCEPSDACSDPDCGCFSNDSYWIHIVEPDGRTVARVHLWAAYGAFDVVPFDLVNGPGDELLVVRVLGRSSPPNGLDLKIFRLGSGKGVELLESYQVAGNLSGDPMACGRWRSRLLVDDPGEAKPRSIAVQHDVIVPADCRLDQPWRAESTRRQRPVLRFWRERYFSTGNREPD